ncbi:MAG: PadR family transcriptional regulator [Bacillota bacterium]
MSITADLLRGHTDTIILAHLLEHDSYGYQINKAIAVKSCGVYELKEATLYTAFKRLEKGGFIASYWGDENTGARRKYYRITPLGREKYFENLSEWNSAKELISSLLLAQTD